MSKLIRYLHKAIREDAFRHQKIALISGPRQVGKTTLAKSFLENPDNYYSYDQESFRRAWNKNPDSAVLNRVEGPIVLDEIHKDRSWKRKLKGIYDTKIDLDYQPLIVTGSAKLELFRKRSDSLMGRFLPYRLHPLSVAENSDKKSPQDIFSEQGQVNYSFQALLDLGGFPEPFFTGRAAFAQRWSRLRLERLIQEDIRDILNISDMRAFQSLAELIPERVGSQFSLNSLKEDVGKAYATIRSWYQVLETLYYCFSIKPYSKKITRSLRAEPRVYLFDILKIPKEKSAKRLENLSALHLLKACHYWTDTAQGEFSLSYLRDKSQREVDFLISRDSEPWLLIECKSGEKQPSKNLIYFKEILKPQYSVQLVRDVDYERMFPALGIRVVSYEKFFSRLV